MWRMITRAKYHYRLLWESRIEILKNIISSILSIEFHSKQNTWITVSKLSLLVLKIKKLKNIFFFVSLYNWILLLQFYSIFHLIVIYIVSFYYDIVIYGNMEIMLISDTHTISWTLTSITNEYSVSKRLYLNMVRIVNKKLGF